MFMKRILLIIVLLISNVLTAQLELNGNAYYRLNCSMSLGSGFDGGPCGYGGLEWFYLQKRTGQIYLKNNDGSMWESTSSPLIFNSSNFNNKFDESDLITSFRIRSNHRTSSLGSCYTESLFEHSVVIQKVNNVTYSDGQVLAQYFSGSININTFPVVNLVNTNPANNIIGDDDYIDISNISGIVNQYYYWQYAANSTGPWIDLPISTSSNNSLHIKPNAFLPNSLIGSKFYLRVNTRVSHAAEQGTFITLFYRKSAPHIVNSPELTPTSCFDSNDGTVKFTFDRLLDCNGCKQENKLILGDETLNYSLLNTNTNSIVKTGNIIMNSDKTFTITGLNPGSYKINFTGFYNNEPTYASGINHTRTFTINKPNPVAFTTSKTNIWCNGGNDGAITINATEGTTSLTKPYQYSLDGGTTWTAFSSGNTHTITGLPLGNYTIKVRDGNACVAKIQTLIGNVINLGAEKTNTETISQPTAPVSINYTLVQQPPFNGGNNGKIVVAITGGTILTNNTYDFVWKNSAGVIQTSTTTSFSGGIFNITLNNIPSDTYTLTVKDKNFNQATQQGGCGVLNSIQFLAQPDPIVVTFKILKTISCHKDNAYGNETDANIDGQRDESQDGIIEATVTGGVPLAPSQNSGNLYYYNWKKLDNNNQWQPLDYKTFIAKNLSYGLYALNVTDANGISMGNFTNGIFTPVDKTILLAQPDKLEISFAKQDISCGDATNGLVTANIIGGVPPYRYEWNSTTNNANTITGLAAGNYFVKVTDAKGCVVQGAINLPQPAGITIEDVSLNPNCTQGSDGSIDLKITGGRPPFTYTWNTQATTEDLTNLVAGKYIVIIKDKAGCEFTHTVTLTDPNPIVVNLGADRTLCNAQSHEIDITINDPNAQYSWTSTNGFSSNKAKVSVTQVGIYNATVISSKGCVAQDAIEIKKTKATIQSEFFVTSQAYLDEEVMLVNTSNPFGENTQWVIPADAIVMSQESKFTVLKFNTTGTKTISLKQTQGDCYALYTKNITVEDRGTVANAGITNTPFIKDFIITPNPSNGKFTTIVNLQDKSTVKLRLYSYVGQTAIIQKSESGQKNYVVDFDVNLPAGTYVLVLETSQQTLIIKIIIF
jgi:SprB repeat/Secretion system C-terminal sorting domain